MSLEVRCCLRAATSGDRPLQARIFYQNFGCGEEQSFLGGEILAEYRFGLLQICSNLLLIVVTAVPPKAQQDCAAAYESKRHTQQRNLIFEVVLQQAHRRAPAGHR